MHDMIVELVPEYDRAQVLGMLRRDKTRYVYDLLNSVRPQVPWWNWYSVF